MRPPGRAITPLHNFRWSCAKVPLSDDAVVARIAGKGKWKQSLPPLIDTLIALGRARRVKTGVLAID